MAGEITQALSSSLGIRLEDPGQGTFTELDKIDMLNKAQMQLTDLLDHAYLPELEIVEATLAPSSNVFAFGTMTASGLANVPLKGKEGIKAVKVYPGGSNGKWGTEIDIKDIKAQENQFMVCTDRQPGYYIFAASINVLCTTSSGTKIDVYYMKNPPTMSTAVDPAVSASLYGILLCLAEAFCWNSDAQLDRGKNALAMAMKEIGILNSRYEKLPVIGGKKEARQA
jgi:hypothetical protein